MSINLQFLKIFYLNRLMMTVEGESKSISSDESRMRWERRWSKATDRRYRGWGKVMNNQSQVLNCFCVYSYLCIQEIKSCEIHSIILPSILSWLSVSHTEFHRWNKHNRLSMFCNFVSVLNSLATVPSAQRPRNQPARALHPRSTVLVVDEYQE